MLRLATQTDILLLDPGKLGMPPPTNGMAHPALTGVIRGAGAGNRTHAGNLAGFNLVNLGGKHQHVQTSPTLQFVSFEGNTNALHPESLINNARKLDELMADLHVQTHLFPARFRSETSAPATPFKSGMECR